MAPYKYAVAGTTEVLTRSYREYTHAVVRQHDGRFSRYHACGSEELAEKALRSNYGKPFFNELMIVELEKIA